MSPRFFIYHSMRQIYNIKIESRLFGTKNQRVASYTMGQSLNEAANL
jgi:hypothetical protein